MTEEQLVQYELVIIPEGSKLPEHLSGPAERMRAEGEIMVLWSAYLNSTCGPS